MRRVGVTLVLLVVCGCRSDAAEVIAAASTPATVAPPLSPWVAVPGGRTTLGSPADERCREADEALREAEVAAFELARWEVTRAEYAAVMGVDPSFSPGCGHARCPVVSVTWHEAAAYCDRIGARLPSETEWEHAARAGTREAFTSGPIESCMSRDANADRVAWTKASSDGTPHVVGGLGDNGWGLYDMAGNVAEWVADAYDDGGERVIRGGDWYHNAEHARSAARERLAPELRMSWVGFRCARALAGGPR